MHWAKTAETLLGVLNIVYRVIDCYRVLVSLPTDMIGSSLENAVAIQVIEEINL